MLKRLRIKIICIMMAIVTVMLGVIFGLVYHFTRQNLEQESLSMMESMASAPFSLGAPNERPEEIRLPYFVLQLGEGGELIAMGGGYYDLSDEEFLRELVAAVAQQRERTGLVEQYSLRYLVQSTPMGQKIVFADTSSEQAALGALIRTSLLIGLAALLAFFGLSLLLARMAVKPVERAWEQQRQFVADASHELKTPLTVILTNAEMLRSSDYSAEEKGRFLDSIQSMGAQMRGLTESLLTLARVDAGVHAAEHVPVELSELVEDELMCFEPLFFERELLLTGEVEPGLRVRGCAGELRRLPGILLDNAMKYSSPRSEVLLELRRHSGGVLLSVANHGAELSGEELKNIFKRFYRADKARSMNRSYGLGLPIAEGIVKAHRGRIWAESSGGINTFFVFLPM